MLAPKTAEEDALAFAAGAMLLALDRHEELEGDVMVFVWHGRYPHCASVTTIDKMQVANLTSAQRYGRR